MTFLVSMKEDCTGTQDSIIFCNDEFVRSQPSRHVLSNDFFDDYLLECSMVS